MKKKPKVTTLLIGAQLAALLVGYSLRAPELQETALRQENIRQESRETQLAKAKALGRAQVCTPLVGDKPISDKTAAYFPEMTANGIVISTDRPMPQGTPVCDWYGNTGVVGLVNGQPLVTDIKRTSQEELTKILKERGFEPQVTQENPSNATP